MPRPATPQACDCGCGEWTNGGHFRPGHDARLRGDLLRAMREWGGRVRGEWVTGTQAESELSRRHWLPEQHGAGTRARRARGTGTARTSTRTTPRNEIFQIDTERIPAYRSVDIAIAGLRPAPAARQFGVEMEFFGTTTTRVIEEFAARGLICMYEGYNHTTRHHWKIVTDASVTRTGTDVGRGLELVSPILVDEEGFAELLLACDALAAAGAKVDRTCGVHVHHDAADLNPPAIARVVDTYTQAQQHIDSLLPPSRRSTTHNLFCAAYPPRDLQQVIQAGNQPGQTNRQMQYTGGSRFRTVNLEALGRHGTLEFRQHGGSTEGPKVAAWVRLGQALINASRDAVVTGTDLDQWMEAIGLDEITRAFLTQRAAHLARPRTPRTNRPLAGVR